MKVAKYADIINGLRDDNTRAESLVKLTDLLNQDEAEFIGLSEKVTALDKDVATLREVNSRLALRVTETIVPPTNQEPEKSPDEYRDEFINKLAKDGV